jgi:hypothetical protein
MTLLGNTNDPLSPATRAVYDAFNRVGLYAEPSFATDRKALAAALREVVRVHGDSREDLWFVSADDLLDIANELEKDDN